MPVGRNNSIRSIKLGRPGLPVRLPSLDQAAVKSPVVGVRKCPRMTFLRPTPVPVVAHYWVDVQYSAMETKALVLIARGRRLRRVVGLADTLTLRLEALVPPGRESRAVIVEQRLSRRDAERILAEFDRLG